MVIIDDHWSIVASMPKYSDIVRTSLNPYKIQMNLTAKQLPDLNSSAQKPVWKISTCWHVKDCKNAAGPLLTQLKTKASDPCWQLPSAVVYLQTLWLMTCSATVYADERTHVLIKYLYMYCRIITEEIGKLREQHHVRWLPCVTWLGIMNHHMSHVSNGKNPKHEYQ